MTLPANILLSMLFVFAMSVPAQAGPRELSHKTRRPSSSRFEQLQSALRALGVADEGSSAAKVLPYSGTQTRKTFETLLKYVDPESVLKRYATWDDNQVILFQDRDEKQIVDFSLAFKTLNAPAAPNVLRRTIHKITSKNSPLLPLVGLRVALDPGHMGGKFWDELTGKFVKIKGTGYVSEGELALQTCLLLKRELESAGAEVMITRTGLEPVTKIAYKDFDIQPYALSEIRMSTDTQWFDALLMSWNGTSTQLERAPQIQRLKAESPSRDFYFTNRVDLFERSKMINDFHPHLTLVVHFDASELDKLQKSANSVRGYVFGNVLANELSTRDLRAALLRHVFDAHRWVESAVFTAAVVAGVSETTGVPVRQSETDYQAIKVYDGVFARNLVVNREATESAIAYLEVLNYDNTKEFYRLNKRDRSTEIDGQKIKYSSRLDQIVAGLKNGILNYVGSLGKQQPAAGQQLTQR